jgi:3-hydroxyisobutyrate dehydrogenase-like beta-hydroxyacid dehydrogenase
MDIGFIGLGNMGQAMAANLLKGGHRLTVWNRSPAAAADLVKSGAILATDIQGAFAGDIVISMLVDGGVIAAAPKGLLHVNMATISVALAEELTDLHAKHQLGYVAAPVFGRPPAAIAAQLNIVAAGPAALLDQAQPLFDLMGQKTWPMGEVPRAANATKLAGNFMIGAAIEAMAEATTMANGYGVAPAALLDVLTNTLFPSPVYKGYGAQIIEDRYEPAAFKLRLGLKDLRLALAAGEGANVPMPLASLVRDNLLDAMAAGDGDKDFAALATVSQRRAGQRQS